MADKYRVVVCGAGITGVSAAYYLAQAGIRDILLVDEVSPLSLTSDRSTECYRNWWSDPALRALIDRSIDGMERIAAVSGNLIRLNRRGYLYVSADPDNSQTLIRSAESISRAGAGPLRVHSTPDSNYMPSGHRGFTEEPDGADLLLGAGLISKHFPYLTESAVAALHVRRAGWLSAQQLGMYLFERARDLGTTFKSGHVDAVHIANGRVAGVTFMTGERIDCDLFVNAAGPYFKEVGALCGIDLPVHTELHLKLAFEDSRRVIDRDAPLLIWSDPLVLPWQEEERAMLNSDPETRWMAGVLPGGAHTRPEGGADAGTTLMLWDYKTRALDPVFPPPLDEQYPEVVLRGLSVMLPGLAAYFGRATRPRLDGGYYVKTPENRPLVGPTPVEGAYLIGAVSGYGIMSACGAGELLATHIIGSRLPPYADAFCLARYEDPEYVGRLERLETGEL